MIHIPVATVLAVVLLGSGFMFQLSGAGYSRAVTALLTAAVLAQAGPLITIATGQSLWLALGVFAVAASAAAFAGRADARRIILFGGSLAVIQLLDPLGVVMAAGLLPATLAIGRDHADRRQMAGLYALLMFMPLTMAMFLLYLMQVQHFDPAALLASPSSHASAHAIALHAGLLRRLAPAAGVSVIVSPALLARGRLRQAPERAVILVALGVVAAATASALLGVIRTVVPLLAVAAPIVTMALAQRPASPARNREAVIIALLCTAVSWIAVLALAPEAFAGG